MPATLMSLTIALGLCLGAGCAGAPAGASSTSKFAEELKDAPPWVVEGRCTKPPVESPDTSVCGVGSHKIESSRRMNLARKTALGKATGAMSQTMATRVVEIVKSMEDEKIAEGVDGVVASDYLASAETANKMMTSHSFTGVESGASWISPSDTIYVLAVLSVEKARAQLAKLLSSEQAVKGISPAIRQRIIDRQDALLREAEGK